MGSTWQVEYQQETVDLGPDGRPVQGVKIGFKTSHGVHSSVFLSKSSYNVDSVRAAIQAAVTQIDAIHKLSG